MAERLSDGNVSWLGGMDTSRSPNDIAEIQYSKGNNVIIPDSLGGIKARFGIHCCTLQFESKETKKIYSGNSILAEGSFTDNGKTYLICYVSGYVLKFTRITTNRFIVENLNFANRNKDYKSLGWIISVPQGCVVNNGFDLPIYVTSSKSRRTNPSKGEIGIGRMGVYVQHRLFYSDQSGKQIIASDFNQPIKNTLEGTGIVGFMCPDSDERIVAIGKQKSVLGTAEGGNLIWSSDKDIYSTDVRGSRSSWANLGQKVGKTTETVPGVSATSAYSFEAFNTNMYFRNAQLGMADIKQSEAQFAQLDTMNSQAIEASYYFDNDTSWMLGRCYTKKCNKRLFTTVSPEKNSEGHVYWNGILSFFPAAVYSNQGGIPRRFESVFTGVRPWCLTTVTSQIKDELFIHSYDIDGVNRLYVMDETTNYDIDQFGKIKEIEGFIETRSYNHKNPLLLKQPEDRFYRLNLIDRSVKITLFSRPEINGPWTEMATRDHLVCRTELLQGGIFFPVSHKGQTRAFVNLPTEKFDCCYKLGSLFISLQYRIEFKGPINLDSVITIASLKQRDTTMSQPETECQVISYTFRPDYKYSITNSLDV